MSEVGRRRSEVGSRMSEVRSQRSEDRGQETEVRGRKSEDRGREARGQRSQGGGRGARVETRVRGRNRDSALHIDRQFTEVGGRGRDQRAEGKCLESGGGFCLVRAG